MSATNKKLENVEVTKLKPYDKNAKLHPDSQIEKIADSIERFGFVSPIIVDTEYNVIAGHGRLEAAKRLKMKNVPCVVIDNFDENERRAYLLADNALGETGWNLEMLEEELLFLETVGFDREMLGFDEIIDQAKEALGEPNDVDDGFATTYEVIVECADEQEQAVVYEELVAKGLKCRVATL